MSKPPIQSIKVFSEKIPGIAFGKNEFVDQKRKKLQEENQRTLDRLKKMAYEKQLREEKKIKNKQNHIPSLVRENSFIPPLVRENSSDYYDINDKDSFANSLKRFQDPKEHRAFIEEYENTPSYKDAISRIQNRDKWSPFTGNTDDYELNSLRKVVEDIHNSKSGGKKKISRRKKRKIRKTHKKIHSNKNRK